MFIQFSPFTASFPSLPLLPLPLPTQPHYGLSSVVPVMIAVHTALTTKTKRESIFNKWRANRLRRANAAVEVPKSTRFLCICMLFDSISLSTAFQSNCYIFHQDKRRLRVHWSCLALFRTRRYLRTERNESERNRIFALVNIASFICFV